MNKQIYAAGAVGSGGLLALMIFLNGELARYTSPTWSSFIAHFVGIFGSWLLWKLIVRNKNIWPYSSGTPLWAYLGGVGGALIVVVANITVNSSLGLVGSLSLMILGQACLAMLFDLTGWFSFEKRKLMLADVLQVICIVAGSILIIWSGG
ncbi:MAG: DMT family transporter [Ardenticatenaceae bacterium]|nr:DMT family transporter [Ardenticatenaceae bacterium]